MSVPEPFVTRIPVFDVRLNGQRLESSTTVYLHGITVDDHTDLPSMFALEFGAHDNLGAKPRWLDEDDLFAIGDEIDVRLGYAGEQLQSVMVGEVTGLEPIFASDRLPSFTVRGYDRRHRLQRDGKIRTFVKKKDSDIAAQIAQEAGLQAEVEDTQVEHAYVIQANQTDMEFLRARARRINFEIVVTGKKLIYREVPSARPPILRLSLEQDLSEFRAHLSSVGQVAKVKVRGWDPIDKIEVISEAARAAPMRGRRAGPALVEEAFGSSQELLTLPLISAASEAEQIARCRLQALALGLIRGEGACSGRPDLRAGTMVDIQGIGKRFSGAYYVTVVSHRYGIEGYSTHFTAWSNAA
jgi:uncharacterized protein